MHSSLVRLQNVSSFVMTVAICIASAIAVSVLVFEQTPTSKIKVRNLQVVTGRPYYNAPRKYEYAHIRFDLDADFSSLFNWNTKQLFVWITATYPSTTSSSSSTTPLSQSIIWDQIINSPSQLHPFNPLSLLPSSKPTTSRKSKKKSTPSIKKNASNQFDPLAIPGNISLRNVKPKYQITDLSGSMGGRQNVTLEIGWNVQPWVGVLQWTMPEGKNLWRWKGVEGGRSRAFTLPDIKGKKVEGAKETPKAGKAKPVVDV